MNDAMTREEAPRIVIHRVCDLMLALLRAVLWPFRWYVGTILLMQITSQLLLLASMVLPWQLLQMLTSGHSRLDGWMIASRTQREGIILLIALALLCFGGYALLRWGSRQVMAALSCRILARLDKTRLVSHHRPLGRRLVGVVIGALSSTLVALLFLGVVTLLEPLLALLMAAIVLGLTLWVVSRYRFERVQRLRDVLQGQMLTLINIAFVLGFVVIVHDYLNAALSPLLTLFILLLALRQLMAASINALVNALGIIKRFRQINMLLLPRSQQIQLAVTPDFVSRFDQGRLEGWLPAWLGKRLPHASGIDVLQCRLLYRREVAQILIYQSAGEGRTRYLLLKCYESARENEAQHEVALLSALEGQRYEDARLVPRLLDSGCLPWCFFVLLEMEDMPPQWKDSLQRYPWRNRLRQELAQTPLPEALIARYRATFAALPERMQEIDATRFAYLMPDDRAAFQLDRFLSAWPRMAALVAHIPECLTVQNPEIARLSIIDDEIRLMDWQGWVVDTLGAYWTLSGKLHSDACDVLTALWRAPKTRQRWSHFSTLAVAADHLALAARAHEFCQRYRNLNDAGALNMISGLLSALETIEESRDPETDSRPLRPLIR